MESIYHQFYKASDEANKTNFLEDESSAFKVY